MPRIAKFVNSISLKVISVIIILVLPLNIIAVSVTNSSVDATIEQARMTEKSMAEVYMSNLEGQMNAAFSLLYYFQMEDPNCIQMTLQKDDIYEYNSAKYKFYANLKRLADLSDGADGYFYYMEKKGDILVYSEVAADQSMVKTIKEFIPGHSGEKEDVGWHVYEFYGKEYLLMIADSINVCYGAWFNLESRREFILSNSDYKNMQVYFNEEMSMDSPADTLQIASASKNIALHILLDKNEVLQGIAPYQFLLRAVAIIYLILIPLILLFLHQILIKPLRGIVYAHRQIQGGNADYRLQAKVNSEEYRIVYHSFNSMADNLHQLRIEAYERELARQKMELRNLQLQIRPHFLLNTFNLVYTLEERGESDSVKEIIVYLSDYFRYIFRSDEELMPFSQELEMIKGYIGMVSIRYQGMICMGYYFDPEIEFVRTPPLLIHNFIENAVKYGIKDGEMLHISLCGEYTDNMVYFYITDDGNGMDEETLRRNQRIFDGSQKPDQESAHIGLYNSMKRLKHFYGEAATVEVISEKGKMTSFTVSFPYQPEVDNESFNGQ